MAEATSLSHALRAGYGTLGQRFLSAPCKKPVSTCLILLAEASLGANLGFSGGKLDSTSCTEGLSIRLRIQIGLWQGEALGYQCIASQPDQEHQDALLQTSGSLSEVVTLQLSFKELVK